MTRFNSVGEPFDPRFHQGRSLKRAIQKELETSLGKLLLKGEVGDGRTVVVDADAARDYFPSEIRRGVAAANSRKISLVSIRDSVYPYDRNKDMPVSSLNFCSWLTLTGLLSRLNFN